MVSMTYLARGSVRSRLAFILGISFIGTLCLHTTQVGLIKSAHARPKPEAYPIIGAVSTRVSMNHSLLTPAATSAASAEYNLPESQGFGWSTLSLNASLSHTWKFS